MASVSELVEEWMKWDQNPEDRAEIAALRDAGDTAELERRLVTRVQFGTAGLRARMGAGYSRMCDLVIIQTTQGLVRYMQEQGGEELTKRGVVIGYDGRYRSRRFAELTATVFVQSNIAVYLVSHICPTPYVAFGVLHYGAACGVMVTASHNPKDDNGYKLYWSNGSQIVSPHDAGISRCILANKQPWPKSWATDVLPDSPLCKDPLAELCQAYSKHLESLVNFRDVNASSDVRFVYTAMHGVGHEYVRDAFKVFGLAPFVSVAEQEKPDPEFSTVKFPNPEEGKSALDLSIQTAEREGISVILANDPDADRLALAEKLPDGTWKVFTGNEIGALLGQWLWFCYSRKHPDKKDYSDVWMFSSTVSSMILRSIAQKEGFQYEDTLTGFKWMGNKADEVIKAGGTVLMAFEEAIGFMCGSGVLDKDGVSAACVLAEMASYLRATHARSLTQHLDVVYSTYGYHTSYNSYYICHDPALIHTIFSRIRSLDDGKHPRKVGEHDISHVRDLTVGYDSRTADNKPVLPVSSSSQMLTFYLTCGVVLTMRTSGTEPKMKYYSEHIVEPGKGQTREEVKAELKRVVNTAIDHFFQPELNKLIAKAD